MKIFLAWLPVCLNVANLILWVVLGLRVLLYKKEAPVIDYKIIYGITWGVLILLLFSKTVMSMANAITM